MEISHTATQKATLCFYYSQKNHKKQKTNYAIVCSPRREEPDIKTLLGRSQHGLWVPGDPNLVRKRSTGQLPENVCPVHPEDVCFFPCKWKRGISLDMVFGVGRSNSCRFAREEGAEKNLTWKAQGTCGISFLRDSDNG